MSNDIIIEHAAIQIVYNEWQNKWRFMVNGRDYEKESLREAREKIDQVIKETKLKRRKQFEPVPAFDYSFKHGRITSLVRMKKDFYYKNKNGSEVMEVRFKLDGESGGGSCTSINDLIRDNEGNRRLMEKIGEHQAVINQLKEKLSMLTNDDVPALEEED